MTAPTTMSYAERARRTREQGRQGVPSHGHGCEISEISEKSPAGATPETHAEGVAAIWWDDSGYPSESAPVRHIPPRSCPSPRACGRLGPCDDLWCAAPAHDLAALAAAERGDK